MKKVWVNNLIYIFIFIFFDLFLPIILYYLIYSLKLNTAVIFTLLGYQIFKLFVVEFYFKKNNKYFIKIFDKLNLDKQKKIIKRFLLFICLDIFKFLSLLAFILIILIYKLTPLVPQFEKNYPLLVAIISPYVLFIINIFIYWIKYFIYKNKKEQWKIIFEGFYLLPNLKIDKNCGE
ncbi:hypothetical protein SDAV_003077 (plasmid) [Spiroplasma phoeniceum P40]|uniref:Uncharacterized protein n=1 Tax=Spiroplasma phoeniceum P40 TaxID=1276259 RepID=A0A345DSS9_9MOLU|nr:hypothetical protein SDAV_003077 [Spiroplasma phoeniceum P40]